MTPSRVRERAPVESFGDRLRRLRMRRGLTLETLAERAGTTKGYLSMLENGHFDNPTAAILAGLSDAFKVSIDYLVRGRHA